MALSMRSSKAERVLCVCDQGVSRSVNIAHLLKFLGYDALPVGVDTSSPETLKMLEDWADLIILTDARQMSAFSDKANVRVWSIADQYPRPFNPELNSIVRTLIAERDF